jgi:GDP-L-fucose synthase
MADRGILVTGGAGFVGRRFVKRLLGLGHRVTVVDDLSTGLAPDAWPGFLRPSDDERGRLTFHQTDFRRFAAEQPPDFERIFHLAAVVGGRLVIEGDPLAVATDLAIDATFFNWIARHRPAPARVVFFSSSAVYPIADQRQQGHKLLAEPTVDFGDTIGMPDMTYGWSKLTGELLARHAAEKYDLAVSVYRPFSGYGEDQDLSYPFPSIVRRVRRREAPLVVWGSGDQARDFIHIEDCVDAVLASMDALDAFTPLNLGSGVATTFRELARTACRVLGHDAEVINDATKPEGVFWRVGECGRMRKFHTPRIPLEEGIRRCAAHQGMGDH